jgi:hypothetical protein
MMGCAVRTRALVGSRRYSEEPAFTAGLLFVTRSLWHTSRPRVGVRCLGKLGHEGNHQVEKTNGLDESETKNGVGEELATEGGVAGNTVEKGGEDETDTDTGTGKTDGGGTHTEVLGDLDHGVGDLRRVGAALDLEGIAGGGLQEGSGLLALEGLEGAGRAGDGALGGSDGGTEGRASGLGGHLGGHAGGEDTGGSHCDGVVRRGEVVVVGCWIDGFGDDGLEEGEEEKREGEKGREGRSTGRARKVRTELEVPPRA